MKKFLNIVLIIIAVTVTPILLTGCFSPKETEVKIIETSDSLKYVINDALDSAVVVQSSTNGWSAGTSYNSGSGVVYKVYTAARQNDSMYVITNWHVICADDATPAGNYRIAPFGVMELVQADVNENGSYTDYGDFYHQIAPEYFAAAELVGGSSYYDIAILKVTASDIVYSTPFKGLLNENKIAEYGNVSYGEEIFAIGNAMGNDIGVVKGIVSMPTQYIISPNLADDPATKHEDYMPRRAIQVDASLNSGNSGGGLFNIKGELLGIVQSKMTASEKSVAVEGMAYCVPVDIACRISNQIISRSEAGESNIGDNLIKPQVGISLLSNNKRTITADGLKKAVCDVTIGSVYQYFDAEETQLTPAYQADLQKDDIIRIAGNGEKNITVNNLYELQEFIIECWDKTTLFLTVERGGELLPNPIEVIINSILE